MGRAMTRQKIINACIATFREMQKTVYVPNPRTRGKTSTGNLAFNALQYKIEGDTFVVYIDEEVAPYAVYTNEPWVSPHWNGKKNPNEGWWERFCAEFSRRLAQKLRGALK